MKGDVVIVLVWEGSTGSLEYLVYTDGKVGVFWNQGIYCQLEGIGNRRLLAAGGVLVAPDNRL